MTLSEISLRVAESCKSNPKIDLAASLPEEFFYNSLDLCVIDAVFSIGVKYESVKNVISKYKKYIEENYPQYDKISRTTVESISIFENYKSINDFAKDVLNLQRTSTQNGILKAEAVLEILKVLNKYEITTIEAFRNMDCGKQKLLDNSILSVKGQGSGIMLKYLYMLVGNENVCKPDRMLHRYVKGISGRTMTDDELQIILSEACILLNNNNPTLTVRILDNQIWQYQKTL